VGTYTPQSLELTTANGFPDALMNTDGTLYLSFDNTVNSYVTSVTSGGAWVDYNTYDPVTVQPPVGAGYFIYNQGATANWARSFTVQ
jgi:hypothetical protein